MTWTVCLHSNWYVGDSRALCVVQTEGRSHTWQREADVTAGGTSFLISSEITLDTVIFVRAFVNTIMSLIFP